MNRKEEDELTTDERRALELWPTLAPPVGFAERVLARARTEQRGRRWAWAAAAAVTIVAAAGLLGRLAPGIPDRGFLFARERTTLALGQRAVAVAEPGAVLQWDVPSKGIARVQQESGEVFFRVDAGDELRVTTPVGDVRVLGTCFRVEVVPMKGIMMGAVAGAAASAMALVTVYEGRVTVGAKHSERGLEVTAGEAARLAPTRKPAKIIRTRQTVALADARVAITAAANRDATPGFVEVPEETYAALLEASETLQTRVEELEGRLSIEEEMRQEREGLPVESPDDLEELYKKDALLGAFQSAIAEGDLPAQVTAVDCTEYPCIVFGEAVGEKGRAWAEKVRFMDQLMKHPALSPYADDASQRISVWRQQEDDENGEPTSSTAFGVSLYPKSDENLRGPEINKRVDYRVGEVLDPSPGD